MTYRHSKKRQTKYFQNSRKEWETALASSKNGIYVYGIIVQIQYPQNDALVEEVNCDETSNPSEKTSKLLTQSKECLQRSFELMKQEPDCIWRQVYNVTIARYKGYIIGVAGMYHIYGYDTHWVLMQILRSLFPEFKGSSEEIAIQWEKTEYEMDLD